MNPAIQGKGLYGGIQAFAESITPPPLTEPLALHLLVSDDERRLTDHTAKCLLTDHEGRDLIDQHLAPETKPLSVAGHHEWLESLSTPRAEDEIDDALDDMIGVDPDERHAHHRKSGKEVNRLLSLLDSLDNSNGQGGKA